MAEGYQSRFLEFQRFESKFKACLSSSAIQTKFEQHYKRAADIIQQLGMLLTEAEQECVNSWYDRYFILTVIFQFLLVTSVSS